MILVYDVTDERSVHELAQWISDAQIYAPNATCMMLGNKTDLSEKDTLRLSENAANSADQLAREYNIKLHFKVSAKDDTAVMEALDTLAHELGPPSLPLAVSAKQKKTNCQRDDSIVLRQPPVKTRRRLKGCLRQ